MTTDTGLQPDLVEQFRELHRRIDDAERGNRSNFPGPPKSAHLTETWTGPGGHGQDWGIPNGRLHSPVNSKTLTTGGPIASPFWVARAVKVIALGWNIGTASSTDTSVQIAIHGLNENWYGIEDCVDVGTVYYSKTSGVPAVTSTGLKTITGLSIELDGNRLYQTVFGWQGTGSPVIGMQGGGMIGAPVSVGAPGAVTSPFGYWTEFGDFLSVNPMDLSKVDQHRSSHFTIGGRGIESAVFMQYEEL